MENLASDWIPSFEKGVRFRVMGGESVCIVQPNNEAIGINASGTIALCAVKAGKSWGELTHDFANHFQLSSEAAHRDLTELFQELIDTGVLKKYES